MELFSRRALVFRMDDGLFLEPSWIAVLMGQGLIPKSYDPLADAIDAATLEGAMRNMRETVRRTALALPTHAEFIARHCRADSPR